MDNADTNLPNRTNKYNPNRDTKYGGGGPGGSGGGGGETAMPSYGVPFMNIMPQNLIEPSYGSNIYNPQVGSQLGSGVNPFFGPGGTLSGQFGQFLQPGFPAPGPGQTGTPNPFPPINPTGGPPILGHPPTRAPGMVPPGAQPPPPNSITSGPAPAGMVNGQLGSVAGTQPGLFQWANTPYAGMMSGRR